MKMLVSPIQIIYVHRAFPYQPSRLFTHAKHNMEQGGAAMWPVGGVPRENVREFPAARRRCPCCLFPAPACAKRRLIEWALTPRECV
jgi:hypothetical protein